MRVGIRSIGAGLLAMLAFGVSASCAATIVYPDLQVQMPPETIYINHPTPSTRALGFDHISWNGGEGPFEIRAQYNSQTGISQGFQALYSATKPGKFVYQSTVPVSGPLLYNSTTYDTRFALTTFWLYTVGSGGGLGSLVATSPKDSYCIEQDTFVGGIPGESKRSKTYLPSNCEAPTGTLGLAIGWGDQYDASDEGENIDLTGVPDGTYWMRAEINPQHLLLESNTANDITDTKLQISGDTVTVLEQIHPNSTPPAVSLTSPSAGPVSGTVALSANASAGDPIKSVQFLLDGQPLGAPVTSPPYTYNWSVASTPPGDHYLAAQATDQNGMVGSSPASTVSVPFPEPSTIAIDHDVTMTGIGTVTTPSFSTSEPKELLLAMVSSTGNKAKVSGAGLSWKAVTHASGQPGDAEIFEASTQTALSRVSISAMASPKTATQQLTVIALTGATGVGASAQASATGGEQTASYTATKAGSIGFAVGYASEEDLLRNVGFGQTLTSQFLVNFYGHCCHSMWSQYTGATAAGATGQSVTLSDTDESPQFFDPWNLAAVEVLPSSGAGAIIHRAAAPTIDSLPPSVSITNPAAGQTLSGRTPVAASAGDDTGIASVQFLLDGKPIGAPQTSGPYALDLRTAKVPGGHHTLSARATDASGRVSVSAPVAVTIQNPAVSPPCLITDVQTTAEGRGTVRTRRFTDAEPGELLLAFVAADGPAGQRQSAHLTGAGLRWRLARRANSRPGDAEIWVARAAHPVIDAAVTAHLRIGGYPASVTVTSMQESEGIGASVGRGASGGSPAVSLRRVHDSSLLYGVTSASRRLATPRTGRNQVLISPHQPGRPADRFWTQATTVKAHRSGEPMALSAPGSRAGSWNMAAVEIRFDD